MKLQPIEVNGERVFLKKSLLGWKVVYPIKEDGKTNWKHLLVGGSWWNLFFVGMIVLLILGAVSEYSTSVRLLNQCLSTRVPILLP